MGDPHEHIARYCCKLGERLTGDRFTFELISGPTKGPRLAGCVGWSNDAGGGWLVQMNRSTDPATFWHRCLHELAHVVLGHVPKETDPLAWIDRSLISGLGGALAAARSEAYRKGGTPDREVAAEAWALAAAELGKGDLNEYLRDHGQDTIT